MHSKFYNISRKLLTEKKRQQLKKYYRQWYYNQNRFKKLFYKSITSDEMINQIDKKINHKYDILMVHSAFTKLLPIFIDSPAVLLDKLINLTNRQNKTLAMPAFFFGRSITDNTMEYYKNNPFFDLSKTRSQMGIITELFRNYPGVKRSIHPSHSICALGPLADELTSNHHLCDSTFGKGTPYHKMTLFNTTILGIAVEYFRCLTQVHCAEDLLGDQFPIKSTCAEIPITITDNGEKFKTINFHFRKFNYHTRKTTRLRKIIPKKDLMEWQNKGIPFFYTNAFSVTDALLNSARNNYTIYIENRT